jgi:Arc/MetJ family transcription regulator
MIDMESKSRKTGIMKTTVDIPEHELKEAMRSIGAKTKREAILTALVDFNRRNRMAKLVRYSGTCNFPTNEEIEALEQGEHNSGS